MAGHRKLFDYVKRYRGSIIPGVSCVIINVLIEVAMPYITRFAIDDLTEGKIELGRLLGYAGIYAAAALVSAVFALFMRRFLLKMSHRTARDIREDVFQHLTELDHPYYSRQRIGDIMNRMSSDLGSVREFVGYGIHQGTRTVFMFLFGFIAMLTINVKLTLVMLVLLPIIALISFFVLKVLRRRYERSQEQFSSISNFSQESFSGIRTIKGFGAEKRRRLGFSELNQDFIALKMAQSRIEAPLWPMMALLFGIGVFLLLLVGGGQVIRGESTLGEFVQFVQYLYLLQWPMIALGWTLGLIQRGLASWDRIRTILDEVPEITSTPAKGVASIGGTIEYQQVGLNLEGRAILQDINLTIEPGSMLSITGPTGSGKTMLASMLVRLMDPTSGVVRIGGRDLKDYSLDDLRNHIGMARQEPFLFSDTLANNIAFGLPTSDPEMVLHAAEIAQLRSEAELFPEGFETLLGERGMTLSGGQRQRTAISRVIANDPGVLILDDIFSAIDTHTEANILEQLLPVMRERTSILISHRVTTLRNASRILVIEGGRITQSGTHEDLIAQPGYYRELDEMQRLEASLETD